MDRFTAHRMETEVIPDEPRLFKIFMYASSQMNFCVLLFSLSKHLGNKIKAASFSRLSCACCAIFPTEAYETIADLKGTTSRVPGAVDVCERVSPGHSA